MVAPFDPGDPAQRRFTSYGLAAFPDARDTGLDEYAAPYSRVACRGPWCAEHGFGEGAASAAGVVAEVEDEGEYFEPSELWPGPERLLR
ncbi:MAG TPA: hypothetical protein VGA04_00500 [Streptosporangiaceae bacterium]